jgi:hypothetical protein
MRSVEAIGCQPLQMSIDAGQCAMLHSNSRVASIVEQSRRTAVILRTDSVRVAIALLVLRSLWCVR